jgi:hypothetical protein
MSEIYRDNEGVVLKKLGKPVRRTVVDKNTRVSDDDINMEIPSEPVKTSEKPSAKKRTLLANAGPDENGKIDFELNPDCVDYLLQYHESYGHSADAAGIASTCDKVVSGFNKTFKSRMTAVELSPALESRLIVLSSSTESDMSAEEMKNRKPGQRLRRQELSEEREPSIQSPQPNKVAELDVAYMSLKTKSLSVFDGQKVLLSGEKFEICKILNCKNICAVTRSKGKISQNGLMHAACSISEQGQINKSLCPQEAALSEKEEMAYQMFLQQFGDELKAKKMLFISKKVFSPK